MKCRDLSKKKKIKNMNSKMTTNPQLLTTEPKKTQKEKQTKQTTRTGTEPEKCRLHGLFSMERGRGRIGGKVH